MTADEAREVLKEADLLFSEAEVGNAVKHVAEMLTNSALADTNPLVIAVMGGATIFAGQLLPLLGFPLEYDYLHATRYGDALRGGELAWIVEPRTSVIGRTVLLVDDILDEGVTLAAIRARLLQMGAAHCYTAVFADKALGHSKPLVADFVGLTVPNRYVFGFGMDVSGAWRNLPAIYALKE
jgi:hypoxanthine phosphoribosyltransferase